MLAQPVHILPTDLVMLEWGAANPPGANQTVTTGWFDTYRTITEDIIEPASGGMVSTGDESVLGTGTQRRSGLHYLDLAIVHDNPSKLWLTVLLYMLPCGALMDPPSVLFGPRIYIRVEPQLGWYPFQRRFMLYMRMVRIQFTYPNSNPSEFMFSAVLRSN